MRARRQGGAPVRSSGVDIALGGGRPVRDAPIALAAGSFRTARATDTAYHFSTMCGFAGFWTRNGLPANAGELLARMTGCLAHRGPDDRGAWCDAAAGVGLGHRRLSIIDLSQEGHQPMRSASGRYVLSYNGEIYNFRELRAELEAAGAVFRGHSDTEVLLAGIERWGLAGTLRRAAGMFAFALWDREERALHLARDRAGEKPLYVAQFGSLLLFGSELKALRAHPEWRGEIDRDVLALYLRHNYVPAPYCIYRDVRKVRPGTMLSLRAEGGGFATREEEYWSAADVAIAGLADPLGGSIDDGADALDAVLHTVIGQQMVADVPLGAFLSGGIDSTTVVGVMQALSPRPVRTFTIGFREAEFDEAEHAKRVAAHLGTEHTELYVTADEARAVVPRLPEVWDEPFADSSQIPTLLVAELARRHVTVSLSGDGGDELFAGYAHYRDLERAWRKHERTPLMARRPLATALRAGAALSGGVAGALGLRRRLPQLEDRMRRRAVLSMAGSPEAVYGELISQWSEPERAVPGARPLTTAHFAGALLPQAATRTERAMLLDMCSYLPDDILVKVDRASMAVSLEARAPLLDVRVMELAWRMPLDWKVRDGRGKQVLRQVLYRYVPRELIERPKQGFAVPVGAWLRGPLRDWADDLLAEEAVRAAGYLDPRAVRRRWQAHRKGDEDWTGQLWPVLMFQSWLRRS